MDSNRYAWRPFPRKGYVYHTQVNEALNSVPFRGGKPFSSTVNDALKSGRSVKRGNPYSSEDHYIRVNEASKSDQLFGRGNPISSEAHYTRVDETLKPHPNRVREPFPSNVYPTQVNDALNSVPLFEGEKPFSRIGYHTTVNEALESSQSVKSVYGFSIDDHYTRVNEALKPNPNRGKKPFPSHAYHTQENKALNSVPLFEGEKPFSSIGYHTIVNEALESSQPVKSVYGFSIHDMLE
ncbi:hypothetical protein MtrunA17_Chr1g0170361 [Medicago truncatula]|uniref:Uncharacterized protein n=1 Tax=Medicago truncatula TaxID=3880 RepID=A0A396JN80_MEDTR|nr:hypothetical protein MtrunA17_Chr1g0170361 [Medicago truncatula]